MKFNCAILDAVSTIQDELGSRGYALIRGVLPRTDIKHVLGEVTEILSAAGWLLPGHDPLEHIANSSAACGDPDPSFKRTYRDIFQLESFHALPHHPALKRVMKMLVGEQVLIHPKPIGRLIFPNCDNLTVHAHQDYRFMSGDVECFTVWIPFHDCPTNLGPLQILEGSHRLGVVRHEDENLHVPEISAEALKEGDWVGGQINAGDVLIFHSPDCARCFGQPFSPAPTFHGLQISKLRTGYPSWQPGVCGRIRKILGGDVCSVALK